jgi:LacI family transcriptional regulator
MPTLNDIAEAVGVSTMTVSRALADQPGVSEATRARVKAQAAQIGYGGNAAASMLAKGRTNTVGVLTQRVSNDYTSEIMQGIAEVLESTSDYDLVIYSPHRGLADAGRYLLSHSHGATDGLLLVSSAFSRGAEVEAGALCRQGFPCVLIDAQPADQSIPHVIATNYQGGFDATRYLIEIGHRRIGFIGDPVDSFHARERLRGYRAALAQHKIRFDKSLIKASDFNVNDAAAAMRDWIARARSDGLPSAIFCASDNIALGVLSACKSAGVAVPGDLSVIGFDDLFSAATATPPLTTVRQPLREMGRMGAQTLLGLLKQKDVNRRTELPTALILRDTCKPLRAPRNGK